MAVTKADLNLDSGKPVRFLALVWYEGWEFDHPTLLLEPIVRYSPNGTDPEVMIEDAAGDLCVYLERQDAVEDEDVSREFEWRGWSMDRLRKIAAACLAGKQFRKKGYRVTEQWVRFRTDEGGEIQSEYVPSGQ